MRRVVPTLRPLHGLVCLLALLALLFGATALAAASAVEVRVLMLTERFSPDAAPAASTQFAQSLVALRGETEGFQLAVRAPGERLSAELGSGSDPWFTGKVRFLRVGFVKVETPSAGISLGPGRYADPLPRLGASGLATTPGQWAGFVILIDVPRGTVSRTYRGEVVINDENGRPYTHVAFDLRVSPVAAMAPTHRRAFRAIGGFSTGWYLNYAPIGDPQRDNGARLERLYGNLASFFADHYLTPTGWDYGRPDRTGRYADGSCAACWWRSPEFPRIYNTQPWPAKIFPSRGDKFTIERDWARTGDDYLKNAASYWRERDWIGGNTYLWVWDEPGNKQETEEIPAINKLVHKLAPGVNTFATAFPYEIKPARKLCKRFGNRKCHVFSGQKTTNKVLWDGGPDDLDAWLIATNKYYGRWTSGLERQYRIDRARDTWNLLQKLRGRGKEVWSYTYYMPTRSIPQLAIDGPGSDPRLLMVWNGFERNRGWLIWHLNRWVNGRVLNAAKAGPRNPYNDPISSKTPNGQVANGDVSLIYPPVSEQYDLREPTAPPVTSLRLEEIRDGIEDVNLITLHRERFGDAATRTPLRAVFGKVENAKGVGYTWPRYSNANMPQRLEQVRRALIAALER
ncbi:MAG: glycoside hydrolase domain-containing protein [Gaiellaceae bacterium]